MTAVQPHPPLTAWLRGSRRMRLLVFSTLFACTGATNNDPAPAEGDTPAGAPQRSYEIETKLETVEDSTRVQGEVSGLVSASPARVWEVLRNPNNFRTIRARFSESRQLRLETIDEILAGRPELDDDELEKLLLVADTLPGSGPGPAPGTHQYFYRHLDMPGLVPDRWVVVKETQDESKEQDGTYRLVHERIDGSMKHYRSVWTVSRVGETESRVQLNTDMDMGFRVPGFLLSLGKNADMPDTVKAIRSLVGP